MRRCLIVILIGVWMPALRAGAGESDFEERVRGAVARGLMYVEKEGVWWMGEKKCVSCHHTSFLVWTHRAAMGKGFPVEEEKVKEWADWSFGMELGEHKDGGINGSRNLEGLAQMLVMPWEKGDDKAREAFANLLVEGQKEDGFWGAGGQLPAQKRAKRETEEVSAMWIALALDGLGEEEAAAVGPGAALEKAREKLAKVKGGMSVEWAVMRLVLAARGGGDKEEVERLTGVLKKWQRADGGWNWVGVPVEAESDALATGMALWGLREAGERVGDEAVQRGIAFLLGTQRADGTWEVKSTKAAKQEEVLETSVYWGTAWGVIGLLGFLGD